MQVPQTKKLEEKGFIDTPFQLTSELFQRPNPENSITTNSSSGLRQAARLVSFLNEFRNVSEITTRCIGPVMDRFRSSDTFSSRASEFDSVRESPGDGSLESEHMSFAASAPTFENRLLK